MIFKVYNAAGPLHDADQCEVNPYESILRPSDDPLILGTVEIRSLEELRDFQLKCAELSRSDDLLNRCGEDMWMRGFVPCAFVRVTFHRESGEKNYDGSICIQDHY